MYIHVHVMSEEGQAMGEMKRYQVEILLALIQGIVNITLSLVNQDFRFEDTEVMW